jgi:phosphatidate phosphatase APP1
MSGKPINRHSHETRFRHSRESGNPIFFLNQTIVQVFPFLVNVFNQLNLPRIISYLNQKKKWIPAFAGMTAYLTRRVSGFTNILLNPLLFFNLLTF